MNERQPRTGGETEKRAPIHVELQNDDHYQTVIADYLYEKLKVETKKVRR